MKKLLIILGVLISTSMFGQSTINPDTVCVGAVGENYWVTNNAGSNYAWTVNGGGGNITNGQGTNQVSINWGNTPGLYPIAVTVIETNAFGCTDTVDLDIFILLPSYTQIGPFCEGDPCVSLIGNPANGTWTGSGVQPSGNAYEFCPSIAGVGTFNLTYTFGGCSIIMNAVVNPTPILGPINHN